jgi:ParB family chromosome partitioning protein
MTKGKPIAQIKEEEPRRELLSKAIEENLSLSQIKEAVKQLQKKEGVVNYLEESSLASRWNVTSQRIKKAKIWDNPKKTKQLEKLIVAMEKLLDEE